MKKTPEFEINALMGMIGKSAGLEGHPIGVVTIVKTRVGFTLQVLGSLSIDEEVGLIESARILSRLKVSRQFMEQQKNDEVTKLEDTLKASK